MSIFFISFDSTCRVLISGDENIESISKIGNFPIIVLNVGLRVEICRVLG